MFTQRKWQIAEIIIAIVLLIISNDRVFGKPVEAVGPGLADLNVRGLTVLVQNGDGQTAVEQVHVLANALGNWGPAPEDLLIFDPYMMRDYRGAVIDYDEVPAGCFDPSGAADSEICVELFHISEASVRFGPSFFTTRTEAGEVIRTPDDIMATFIEETGHSWQEYAFETDGKMSGARIHQTLLEDSLYWAKGREYQVKKYILSLDGEYLDLSIDQRAALLAAICTSGSYANPLGAAIPEFGIPPGWPAPEHWPTIAPTLSDHMNYCSAQLNT